MQLVNKPVYVDIHKPESATFLVQLHQWSTTFLHTHLYKVVVECTTGCLPAAFVADLSVFVDEGFS